MRKILTIGFILLVSLLAFTGCSTTEVNTQTQQEQTTQNPEPQSQQAQVSGIPQPPALPEE